MIDRKQWLKRHHPVLQQANAESPLTVGNGNFAYSVDVSGLQTLYDEYVTKTPLCTMANWAWHTIPANTPSGVYTLADCVMDRYDFCGREVTYAKTRFPGNEQVYDWLRQNPHKLNLARIGFRLDGRELRSDSFADIHQELDLDSGIIESSYCLKGVPCRVLTACAPDSDILALHIESDLLKSGLTVDLDFPYGTGEISGSDWEQPVRHTTELSGSKIIRSMDRMQYTICMNAPNAIAEQVDAHRIRISTTGSVLDLSFCFAKEDQCEVKDAQHVMRASQNWWAAFWQKGGAVDFSASTDPRAHELERRIVLSLYLLTINSSGFMPPAETGLICNSWFGKAHLEMHFWHMAWAPLWGHSDLLMRSLPWYHAQLPHARDNAARNGYRGARWPKMVGDVGIDCPSPIAMLLVWQQPHIIVMLELIRRAAQEQTSDAMHLMHEHWVLIKETADFMVDYAVLYPDDGMYHIEPPVIPVQEYHEPEVTRDPSFEVTYWKFALGIAIDWARKLGIQPAAEWQEVYEHMVTPPVRNGVYLAHAHEPETFTRTAIDHPSMLQNLGMLPPMDIDYKVMERTLDTVLNVWDYNTLWGWDFAVMAMTAARLGRTKTAIDTLLCKTDKNTYVESGNNRQRNDLPLYLPGNGSLLLAVAMMTAGWDGGVPLPGFSQEEGWKVSYEGLKRYF